jgi:hypothetical protein
MDGRPYKGELKISGNLALSSSQGIVMLTDGIAEYIDRTPVSTFVAGRTVVGIKRSRAIDTRNLRSYTAVVAFADRSTAVFRYSLWPGSLRAFSCTVILVSFRYHLTTPIPILACATKKTATGFRGSKNRRLARFKLFGVSLFGYERASAMRR